MLATIKAAIGAVWDFFQNLIPIERWLAAIGNVLKYLGLAFIIVALLFAAVLIRNWGLTDDQRFTLLILLIMVLMLALVVVIVLGMRSGDLLYSPYERSLRRGRNYGVKGSERTRREEMQLPTISQTPELPPPAENFKALPK